MADASSRTTEVPTVVAALVIEEPADGAVVTSPTLVVSGTGPSGARIVHDITFAPDEDVEVGADGRWTIEVELRDGANKLTFRIDDDKQTSQTITVSYAAPASEQPAGGSSLPAHRRSGPERRPVGRSLDRESRCRPPRAATGGCHGEPGGSGAGLRCRAICGWP